LIYDFLKVCLAALVVESVEGHSRVSVPALGTFWRRALAFLLWLAELAML